MLEWVLAITSGWNFENCSYFRTRTWPVSFSRTLTRTCPFFCSYSYFVHRFDKKIFNVDGTEIDDDDNPIRKRTCPHCQQRINVDPKNKNQAEKCEIKN
uniref:Uncharacterized protein n=1 Tax=Meloidogyne incognita TaxID=6306 RepID=A0A914KKG8_MELIC